MKAAEFPFRCFLLKGMVAGHGGRTNRLGDEPTSQKRDVGHPCCHILFINFINAEGGSTRDRGPLFHDFRAGGR